MSVVYNFPVQCLRGDQRVLTVDGWRSIAALVPQLDTLIQPSGKRTGSFRLRSTGLRQTYAVQTQGRRIISTIEHRFLGYRRDGEVAWRKVRQLKPGDYVAIDTTPARRGHDPRGVTPKIAEVLGALLGDGNCTGRGFTITCAEKKYATFLRDCLVEAWPDVGVTVRRINKKRVDSKQLWCVSAESRLATTRLENIGICRTTAKHKALPAWAETATQETRCALLRGLFDTDSVVTGETVTFTSTSEQLAVGAQRLLLSIGIDVRLYRLKRGVFRLIVRPAHVDAFQERVGFRYAIKRRRLKQRRQKNPITALPPDLVQHVAETLRGRLPRRGKSWNTLDHARLHRACQGSASREQLHAILAAARPYAKVDDLERALVMDFECVVSITPVGRAQTFDLEIFGNDHGYVAEGLITHNSTAADIVDLGILAMVPELPFDAHLILQGHDSVVIDCRAADAEHVAGIVTRTLSQTFTVEDVTMDFPANADINTTWAKL
jgi:hypothetical protein